MSLTLIAKDSKRKERTITVLNGFTNANGTKCAQVRSDNGKVYFVRVHDGIGTCTCESRKHCYHIKAIASANNLLTVEELEQVAANAELDVVGAALLVVNQCEAHYHVGDAYDVLAPTKKITCPGCGKQDEYYYKYGKCYWIPDYSALAE